MIKNYIKSALLLGLLSLFLTSSVQAQLNLPRGSQQAKVEQTIGLTKIIISYSRPSVNEREIWGNLVPYGMNNLGFGTATESPWRAGADENTVIEFTDDVSIEGNSLAKGTYGFHVVVEEDDTATLIFSKDYEAWGSYFYEPANDALRVEVKTNKVAHTEELTFLFKDLEPNATKVALLWEEKEIPFKVQVDVSQIVLEDIRKQLQNSPGFSRQSWEQAANYALNNDGDLQEALTWIDAAIEGQFFSQKTFNNLSIKSRILDKQGNSAAAEKTMEEALAMATVFETHAYGRQLIAQGKAEKALEIFKMNAKKHKGEWPVDYGLARGYSANKEYDKALKHIKIAETRAPDQINKNAIATNMALLEEGKDIN